MKAYRYRAACPSGQIVSGTLAASSEFQLAELLKSNAQELIEARPESKQLKNIIDSEKHSLALQREIVCAELSDLLRAGLPLLSGLKEIQSSLQQGALSDALTLIIRDINDGIKLSDAFARHPALFPAVFLSYLQSGEASGQLAETFCRLSRYLAWEAKATQRLKRALRYPLFLLILALCTTCFMMLMVVPQIVGFLTSLGTALPLSTRALIAMADFFSAVWLYGLGLAVAGGFLFALMRAHSDAFRLMSDRWFLSLPVVGRTYLHLYIARFTESFALLLQSGLSVPESLDRAGNALSNLYLIEQAKESAHAIQTGIPFSAATASFFPSFVVQLARIGEQSGQLPKAMEEASRAYDARVNDKVERMIGTLEPALTLLIGCLLAWVVMAVLGPLYTSLGSIGRGI